MLRSLTRLVLACLLATLPLPRAAAVPGPLLSDFSHTAWGSLQGAPVNVLKFAQTADGWLWLATATGLYRYDGVRFERVQSVYGQPLQSANILGLMADAGGALWVGYRLGGVTVFRPGGATSYGPAQGLPAGGVIHIEGGSDGSVWVGTRDGVARLAPGAGRFEALGEAVGLPGKFVYQILLARDGTEWVASLQGLFFRKAGQHRFTQAWPRVRLLAVAEAPDGTIWARDASYHYFRVLSEAPVAGAPVAPAFPGMGMRFDRDGIMWVLHSDGLERRLDPAGPAAADQRLTQLRGMSGPQAQCFHQDREGNLWIGTATGVDRLRPTRLKPVARDRQFENPGIAQGPDGAIWIGDAVQGVVRLTAAGIGQTGLAGIITASYRAPDGILWFGTDRGLHRVARDGRIDTQPYPEEVQGFYPQAMQAGPDGALWMSFSSGPLYRFQGRRWIAERALSESPNTLTVAMAADAGGVLWLGHAENAISLVADGPAGRSLRRLDAAHGLALGAVLRLVADGPAMWAGGERGVALFRDGRFMSLRGLRGERFRGVSGIVRLPDGELWLHGADGIFRIDADAIAAWLRDASRPVAFERFDAQDGLVGHAPQLRPLPSLLKSDDGRLWFTSSSAVAVIDPARIRRNPVVPPVLVSAVTANGRTYETAGARSLTLPKGSDNLQVAFTALSYSIPERVRFRYRLAGVDRAWQEPSGRREAFYTNLQPGTYRFEVSAANEDGIWNTAGAALDVHLPPTFTQTLVFKLLLAVAACALLYALHALRIHVLARRIQERTQERLAERIRIARALHDTLLQSVQGLIMSFHAHIEQVPEQSPARARLERTLRTAEQLLVDGRDEIMELRAESPPDRLGHALAEFGHALAQGHSHVFACRVSGTPRRLHAEAASELCAIAREALSNAARYANARHIELELEYHATELRLAVSDDGCGLPDSVAATGQRPGHWGLVGMRERARCIGARIDLASTAGQGTRLTVLLAAELAYSDQAPRHVARDNCAAQQDTVRCR